MANNDRAGLGRMQTAARLRLTGALVVLAASVAACTTGSVLTLEPAVDVGAQTAAVPQASGFQSLVPSNPYMVSYPRMDEPAIEPDVLPAEEIACRRELNNMRVAFTDIAPINDGGACVIDHPVKISAIGSVQLKPAATVTCSMAKTFANWTKNELVPSARLRYLSGVKTIHQGSSYSCRNIRRATRST